ncbi:MAG: hypothetical protein ACRD0D_08120, partial [Acidimicrobiales bacterium]
PAAAVTAGGGTWALADAQGRVLAPVAGPPEGMVAVEIAQPLGPAGSTLKGAALGGLRLAEVLAPSVVPKIRLVKVTSAGELEIALAPRGTARLGAPERLEDKALALATLLERADLRRVTAIDLRAPAAPVLTRS